MDAYGTLFYVTFTLRYFIVVLSGGSGELLVDGLQHHSDHGVIPHHADQFHGAALAECFHRFRIS